MEADSALPRWKAGHLAKNYSIYSQHREFIDPWAEKWGVWSPSFPPSRRKLEWQAQHTPRLWDMVMHLRPSGIRAKAPTYLPALVAITQTSVVGPRERRLSPRETARLQGLPDTFDFGDQRPAVTYRQMGNGVNVGVVWHIFREHALRDERSSSGPWPAGISWRPSARRPCRPTRSLDGAGLSAIGEARRRHGHVRRFPAVRVAATDGLHATYCDR